ncbi:hypothetical protein Bbelb_141500 [Branchiostoma belcheri]|nr:hypothetical protein Bbelb_141500 [Branchiostoma belcheri]
MSSAPKHPRRGENPPARAPARGGLSNSVHVWVVVAVVLGLMAAVLLLLAWRVRLARTRAAYQKDMGDAVGPHLCVLRRQDQQFLVTEKFENLAEILNTRKRSSISPKTRLEKFKVNPEVTGVCRDALDKSSRV